VSYRQLVEALGIAVDYISELQRYGCPGGCVAVPSRIRDAYLVGKAALEPDSTEPAPVGWDSV
jgi:hypothetical protein